MPVSSQHGLVSFHQYGIERGGVREAPERRVTAAASAGTYGLPNVGSEWDVPSTSEDTTMRALSQLAAARAGKLAECRG